MKNKSKILISSLVIGLVLILSNSCKKNEDNNPDQSPTSEVPTLTTISISNITANTASCGGNITLEGNSTVTARGVCWSTGQNPTFADSKTTDGSGTGSYTSELTGLTANTTYYARAYATNISGTAYGNEVSFTTADYIPVTAPCEPSKNSIVFNLSKLSFNNVSAGTYGLSYGDYGLEGNGSSGDLSIEFSEVPATGTYKTISPTSFIGSNECIVGGVFGGTFSYYYSAFAGDTVYVTKNGEGLYSITFCNLHFGSGSTSYDFYSDGNLTSE